MIEAFLKIVFGIVSIISGLYVGPQIMLSAFEKNCSTKERPFLLLSGIAIFLAAGFLPLSILWLILTWIFPCDILTQPVCYW
ncbi:MAG: hypothetical protein OHK0050_27180 [Roseiflexaceae bacterium]